MKFWLFYWDISGILGGTGMGSRTRATAIPIPTPSGEPTFGPIWSVTVGSLRMTRLER